MDNMKKQIYLDNACTTFPKPECVAGAVYEYMTKAGSNINRGCYAGAYNTEEMVFETRTLLNALFNGPDERNVIFTRGITESLNIVIKGYLKAGDHVLVSPYEHNAVMRPLNSLSKSRPVSFDRIPVLPSGSLDVSAIPGMIKDNTKAVIITHASNVSGIVMPIEEIGKLCRERGIKLIVDSAQSAGTLNIDMKRMCIDALTFTGHKGLMGPQGIGGMILSDEMAKEISPFIEGGTGSISDREETPDFMPDKFEAGTLNIPGIAGLNAALKWIDQTGIDAIHEKECHLADKFAEGIADLSGAFVSMDCRRDKEKYVGVVSINCLTMDNSDLAAILDEKYGIQTRVGLHCSPAAHKTLGSYPSGTVRFSFGYFNTEEDVEYAVSALKEIMGKGTIWK